VPRSTAYRWAGRPEVRSAAESCRRRACNRALRRMARRAYWESHRIAELARIAESEPVKLQALRSILADAAAVSNLSHLKRRVAAIQEELHEHADNAAAPCSGEPCSLVDICLKNPKTRHFVSLFLSRKTPFSAASMIRISFLSNDIRIGLSRSGESKSPVAHLHRKTPENRARCSLAHGGPFVRPRTRPGGSPLTP
jgi:hypothetical protein